MQSPGAVRARFAAYYEALHWRKFLALWASLGTQFCLSCGCADSDVPRPVADRPGMAYRYWAGREYYERPTTRPGGYHAGWRIAPRADWQKPELRGLTGLVTAIWFGRSSKLRLDVTGAAALEVGDTTYYSADPCIRLNGTELTFLLIKHRPAGTLDRTGKRYFWETSLYLQIDCREEMERVKAAHRLVAQLRRNHKSYFSWLPRDLICLIQFLLLTL